MHAFQANNFQLEMDVSKDKFYAENVSVHIPPSLHKTSQCILNQLEINVRPPKFFELEYDYNKTL